MFQIIAVLHSNCSEYKCVSPSVTTATKTIKNWAYHKLYIDPLVAAKEGMPSGNDLRYTVPGIRKTHP